MADNIKIITDNSYEQIINTLTEEYCIPLEALVNIYGDCSRDKFRIGIQELYFLLDRSITFTDQLRGIIDRILSNDFTYETIQAVSECNIDNIIDFHKYKKSLNQDDAFKIAMACYRIFVIIIQNKKCT